MKKTISKSALTYGEKKLPFGYGVAYWDFALDEAILYPVGINLLVRWLRNFY